MKEQELVEMGKKHNWLDQDLKVQDPTDEEQVYLKLILDKMNEKYCLDEFEQLL